MAMEIMNKLTWLSSDNISHKRDKLPMAVAMPNMDTERKEKRL